MSDASALGDGAAIRERNLHAIYDEIRLRPAMSRTDLVASTSLSKPTVGAAVRALQAGGLIQELGRTTGRRGPTAPLYGIDPAAATVGAIDIGTRYVRARVVDLGGSRLSERSVPLRRPSSREVMSAIREIGNQILAEQERMELVVVGTPGFVDPASGLIGSAPNIEGWDGTLAERVISDALGLPVIVENDVNLAALGEKFDGAGQGVDSFAYLSIGSGLGAGLVLYGQLYSGAHGGAGEVGFLPMGADPFAAAGAAGGAMEARLSSRALEAKAAELAGEVGTELEPPFAVDRLFAAARLGDPLGRAVVNYTAREIALCVAGVFSVVDVELVLIGGGIGSNVDLLLPDVRKAAARLLPTPPAIAPAALGDEAVRRGAGAVGLDAARSRMIRRLMTSSRGTAKP